MDNRKAQQVHRSYVDAVKQMEPLDAQILRRIYDYNTITTFHVTIHLAEDQQQYYVNAMPYHIIIMIYYVSLGIHFKFQHQLVIYLGWDC